MTNITVTPGTGKTVATETISSVDFQQVKLIDPTVGSTSPIGNTANPMYIQGAVTATVSGTVTTSPSGTQTVTATNLSTNVAQVGGTATDTNSGSKSAGTLRVVLATDQPQLTNALKVDGSAVTQPVSAASLPLPTGASTAAKQPALGTAGTPSADVITVQGVTSMTALKVDGSGVTQPVSGTVTVTGVATATKQSDGSQKTQIVDGSGNVIAATSNALNVAVVSGGASGNKTNNNAAPSTDNIGALTAVATTAAPSYTNNNLVALSTDLAGALRVTGSLSVGGTTDNSAYTAGTSTGTPAMGFYHSTIDTVTDGRAATVAITPKRAMMVNLQNASGAEIGVSGAPIIAAGAKTNNAAVPGATNLGTLPAIANTAAPSYADGNQVALSTDTSGQLRVVGSLSVGGTTDNSAFTAGTSTGTPSMGFYHSTVDTVTDGRSAAVAITPKRAQHATLHTAAGVETGVAAAPLQVSLANTASNATAVKVDGSAVTQPVSGSVTVSGTVTANAGTNLNTSLLALETGGNLATIKTNTDNLALAQASTTSGQKGNLVLGATTTAAPTYTTAQSNPLSLTTAGALRTDSSGTTQPVSGTVAATQSGTWTVQPGNTANTTAWKVDGSAVTQPISAASLPLPALAATSTKQSDGTQKTQIVDGSGNVIASTSNALNVNISSGNPTTIAVTQATASSLNAQVVGNVASGASDSGNPVKVGGVFNTTLPTLTNGQRGDIQLAATGEPLIAAVDKVTTFSTASTGAVASTDVSNYRSWSVQMTNSGAATTFTAEMSNDNSTWAVTTFTQSSSAGNILADVFSASGSLTNTFFYGNIMSRYFRVNITANNGTAAGTVVFSPFPVSPKAVILTGGTNATQSTNVAQIGSVTTAVNNGTASTGTQRVTIASDSTGNIATIGTSVTPGTGATNLGKAEDAAAANGDTGVFVFGVRNDTAADRTSTDADYSQISTDIKGRVLTSYVPRSLKTSAVLTLTSSTTETTVLAAIASTFLDVYGVVVTNSSATATNVSFRDTTGAGTIKFNVYVPAGETRGFMLPSESAIPQASVNTNWTAQCGTSVASVQITMLAVKNI